MVGTLFLLMECIVKFMEKLRLYMFTTEQHVLGHHPPTHPLVGENVC